MAVQSSNTPPSVKKVTSMVNLGQGCQSGHLTGFLKSLTLDDSYIKCNKDDDDDDDDDDDYCKYS